MPTIELVAYTYPCELSEQIWALWMRANGTDTLLDSSEKLNAFLLQESRDLLKLARRHSGRGKHQVLERLPTAGRLVRLNCPVRHLCQRMRN